MKPDVLGEKDQHAFFFPGRPALMNANRARNHWQTQRRLTKELREVAAFSALGVPPHGRVEITSWPTYANRRSWPDVGAWAPALKAIVDGFVDAGVLRADDSSVVVALHYLAPQLGEADGLHVVLRPA